MGGNYLMSINRVKMRYLILVRDDKFVEIIKSKDVKNFLSTINPEPKQRI